MAPRIYKSSVPSVPIVARSIFTHLFSSSSVDDIGGFPATNAAFIDAVTGTKITRAQLKRLALCFGYGLRHHPSLLLKRNDTVLIYSPNSMAWPVVLFGSIAAGLRCTLANSAYTTAELKHQYVDSEATLVMTSEEGLGVVREMLTALGLRPQQIDERIILLGSGLDWAGGPVESRPDTTLLHMELLLNQGSLPQEEQFNGDDAHETVLLCYSSGTTGKPKGVELSHRNLTSVIDMVKTLFPVLDANEDILLGVLPFYHIYGAIKLLHFPFACGVPVVIQTRFDPDVFCQNIERYRVTLSLIVPPVLVVFARHPAVEKYDLSSLKTLFSGAAPLGAALVKQVRERLLSKRSNKNQCDVTQGYGLSETSPTSHLLPVQDSVRKIGSVGLLLPNLEARLVVDGDGLGTTDAEEGQPGELWLRGPTIMKGYLNNLTATEDAITPDGWFKTGDIAFRDSEGYYYIVDRRKELIKYKGFQVPPAELESVLLTHPDIADTAVIGVYNIQEATELPRAYIVPAQPDRFNTISEQEVLAKNVATWIEGKVARHKYLRGGVVIIDAIPKSAAGKILRRHLRDQAKLELETATVKSKL